MNDPSIGRRRRRRRVVLGRVVAALLLASGAALLALVGYRTLGTAGAAARDQQVAARALDDRWRRPDPVDTAPPAIGAPLVRIHVPRFGPGWAATVLEGTGDDVLAGGPGHYVGTALPGQVGNVAVAGHRVTHGAPFADAGELRSCDPVVLETRDAYLVYRVLPMPEEVAGWASGAARRPGCSEVRPLDGPYRDTPGREIVDPDRVDVIAPVPHDPAAVPTRQLLTLTTCHPRYSARRRLVVHAVLVRDVPKPGAPPVELDPVKGGSPQASGV